MGKENEEKETKSKSKRIPEWIKAIATAAASIGIFLGIRNLWFQKEKEASDRLMQIIALLDTKNCQMVRVAASTTMGVYLEDYKKFQKRACWVMANNLAIEEDPLVRDNMLNILIEAEANAIIPLIKINRFILEEEIHKAHTQPSYLFRFDPALQSDLDSGNISEKLREEFKDNDEELSDCTTVLVVDKDSRWLLTNRDNKQIYIVKKEQDQLNVYKNDNLELENGSLSADDKESILEQSKKLWEINKILLAVLDKKGFPKVEKLFLNNIILYNISWPSSKINFENANLKQSSLVEAYLYGVSLKGANLEQADLENTVLQNVNLSKANMRGANLHSIELKDESILRGADLSSALLFSIKTKYLQSELDEGPVSRELHQEFEKVGIYLSHNASVSIEDNNTEYLIFDNGKRKYRIRKGREKLYFYTDAILTDARMLYTDLTDADLTNANLSRAFFIESDLTDANLVSANLTNADLSGTVLTDVDLTNADLSSAVLRYADLTDANLSRAVCINADLFGADLTSADIGYADLEGANLEGANLYGIRNWRDIKSLKLTNVLNVLNAPEGFLEWANEMGAITVKDYHTMIKFTKRGQVATFSFFEEVMRLTNQGKIHESIAALQKAQKSEPALEIPAEYWNNLGWNGCTWGYDANEVMFACERAVELDPENRYYRDTRGLARALTGDIKGAIEDFQFFIDRGQGLYSEELILKRQQWIKELEAGSNPFDEATLNELRNETDYVLY